MNILIPADNDDEGFDLIQPSLIQQLRTILDQYPDDGQILKVTNVGNLSALGKQDTLASVSCQMTFLIRSECDTDELTRALILQMNKRVTRSF